MSVEKAPFTYYPTNTSEGYNIDPFILRGAMTLEEETIIASVLHVLRTGENVMISRETQSPHTCGDDCKRKHDIIQPSYDYASNYLAFVHPEGSNIIIDRTWAEKYNR